MRILSFIGVLIVLMQCLAPCADEILSSLNQESKIELVKTDQHQNPTRDECSPFCQCSCCATPSVTQISFVIPIPFSNYSKLFKEHLPGKVTDTHLTIWQPPKVNS